MKTIKSDVVVCGGGVSGMAAALTAARAGASVAIVEECSVVGGAVTQQFIQMWCGRPFQGVMRELRDRMRIEQSTGNDNVFRAASWLLAYNDFLQELPVSVYTREKIIHTEAADGKINAVVTDRTRFEGKVFIDATGDGDVAAMSGCAIRYGREAADEYDEPYAPAIADGKVQRCTQMYTVKRISGIESYDLTGSVPLDDEEGLVWGPTVICQDTTDEEQLARAQAEAFSMMPGAAKMWRGKGCFISGVAPRLGVRESRRVEGLYVLSYHDIADKHMFPDSICVVNYNIDPWDPEGNPMHDNRLKDTHMPDYEIPFRCMVNGRVENLIVTGRCISATHVANSSLRVMGIVTPLGQAAGNAAALAVKAGVPAREVDIDALRQMQRDGGVKVSL